VSGDLRSLIDEPTLRGNGGAGCPEVSAAGGIVHERLTARSADKLAWRIGLKFARRQRLKIHTIGVIDIDKAQRAERRRTLDRNAYTAARRAKASSQILQDILAR